MSNLWIKNLKPGMLVRIISSIEVQLIGKLAVVKEVTHNSPRVKRKSDNDDDPYEQYEVLVYFPDIPAASKGTTMANITSRMSAAQVSNAVSKALDAPYEKIFLAEHIAPPTTMDRLLYG